MNSEDYKKYIIEMIEKIDKIEYLAKIFQYIHKYFIRKDG